MAQLTVAFAMVQPYGLAGLRLHKSWKPSSGFLEPIPLVANAGEDTYLQSASNFSLRSEQKREVAGLIAVALIVNFVYLNATLLSSFALLAG